LPSSPDLGHGANEPPAPSVSATGVARLRARALRLKRRALQVYDDVPYLRRMVDELARIELLDRSMALGAQALLALIPLLMVFGAVMPADWGNELTSQVRDVLGIDSGDMEAMREATSPAATTAVEVGWFSLVVALASASSFARALARMYCKVWDLPAIGGLGAIRRSLLWIAGWVVTLQILAIALRALSDVPLDRVVHLALQLCFNLLLWWWTAYLLLRGRINWLALLPGATVSAVLIALLGTVSNVFMPRYARINLEQFGPLGVVFAIATWLVVFGGVLVLAAVVGRHLPGVEELRQHDSGGGGVREEMS
jgi:membrane protein